MKKILLLLAALGLAGCSTTMRGPSPEQLATATFTPLPGNVHDLIKAQYVTILKDPYSAVYTFATPQRAYIQGPGRKMFAYVIPVHVNAKNSYGGYTGGQLYHWAWAEGQLYNATNTVKFGGAVMLE